MLGYEDLRLQTPPQRVDETDARILLALPATAVDLADKFGGEASAMETKMNELFVKGLVFKSKKQQKLQVFLNRQVVYK